MIVAHFNRNLQKERVLGSQSRDRRGRSPAKQRPKPPGPKKPKPPIPNGRPRGLSKPVISRVMIRVTPFTVLITLLIRCLILNVPQKKRRSTHKIWT